MAEPGPASAASHELPQESSIRADQAPALGAMAFRLGHAALLLLAAWALAYQAFGLRTVPPAAADWTRLALTGYELVIKDHEVAASERDLAHGGVARFEAIPREAGKNPFSISVVPVRPRQNKDLNLSFFYESFPALTPEAAGKERPGEGDAKSTKVIIGTVKGQRVLQTCITPTGVAATSSSDLNANLGATREQGIKARWLQLLGMQAPARWECAWVTIELAAGASDSARADQDLLAIWADVHAAWRARPPWPLAQGSKV